MINEDNYQYYQFTGPQQVSKALQTLAGIVRGITIDGEVSKAEVHTLQDWVDAHRKLAHREPFKELVPFLDEILQDGVVDEEEQADLIWLCDKFVNNSKYFDAATADMQILHGLLHGILADGVVTEAELIGLREWMEEHENLQTCWPYDEINALICAVMADGVISADEHDQLLTFFSEFTSIGDKKAVSLYDQQKDEVLISGICAMDPLIEFGDRQFCFTGKSVRGSRAEIVRIVETLGGVFSKTIKRNVHYLIIGADGNPCWCHSCYGRKVEQAVQMRRSGQNIVLVHEHDFWDAVENQL